MSNRRVSYAALSALGICLLGTRTARATDGTEVAENGSEQAMRGGAWIARASDPLAVFYNPAGLAGQPTRVVLQGNFGSQRACFTRTKSKGDTTQDGVMVGGQYPQVCNDAGYGVDPQLAMTIRVSPRVGIGFAPLMAPSAAGGMSNFPEFAKVGGIANSPSPGSQLLTYQNILLVTPTLGVGVEILDRLRIGASFQWGIASLKFSSAVASVNNNLPPAGNDIKATLSAHDYFIPGFTLGTLWSPSNYLDVAAWYKWSAPIDASGDAVAQYPYYSDTAANQASSIANTDTSQPNCGFKNAITATNPCGNGGNGSVKVNRPMEAKIGARFHVPRKGIPYDEHVRDPMAQDVFDIEANLTWANDSAMDMLQIRFPSNAAGTSGTLPINLGTGLTDFVPPNADIPFHYSDVFGIRLGGDYNVLPDQLAIRGGGYFQSASQTGTNTQYQNLSFPTGTQFGLALGGTYRIHFGPGSNALELSAGFEHVFLSEEDNGGGIHALAGTACSMGNPSNGVCPATNGSQAFRTPWAVNQGTITYSVNIINAGIGYRF